MKSILLLSAFLGSFAHAQLGPIGSGGPTGKRFLSCEGKTEFGGIYLTVEVRPVPKVDMYISLVGENGNDLLEGPTDQPPRDYTIVRDVLDIGEVYTNELVRIVVPNNQTPDDDGKYTALLQSKVVNSGKQVSMTCRHQ